MARSAVRDYKAAYRKKGFPFGFLAEAQKRQVGQRAADHWAPADSPVGLRADKTSMLVRSKCKEKY